MRLLIPVFSPATGTWGGLTRVVAIGEAAARAGHRFAFCASGYLQTALRQRGYQVYALPATTMFGLPAPLSRLLEKRSQMVSPPVRPGKSIGDIWFVLAISGFARPGFLRRLVEAELQAARDFQPDALFTDLDPGAAFAAEVLGLPIARNYASIIQTGIGSPGWRLMNRASTVVARAFGLPIRPIDAFMFNPSILKIIPSIPELDDTDPSRPDVHYVGHMVGAIHPEASERFQIELGRRYVFVYTGTGSISLTVLRRVLPQVFPQGSPTTCLVGGQSIMQTERIGSVEFHPYVPAGEVLPHCDWTISHSGQNTIAQSLLNGVPLILFPGPIFERRYNARKVQENGAGIMGEVDQFTPAWLQQAFTQRAGYADAAARLGDRMRSFGGAQAAVEAIEALVDSQQLSRS
ncbi:MAG TPA: nucleotide disphospho-sugar-binding domain-containing protein [Anaerolineales bacterium]|nr:nucleotide disphospho-sugar-binding domain-containing protein [Anaerolineales bacterium]